MFDPGVYVGKNSKLYLNCTNFNVEIRFQTDKCSNFQWNLTNMLILQKKSQTQGNLAPGGNIKDKVFIHENIKKYNLKIRIWDDFLTRFPIIAALTEKSQNPKQAKKDNS